MYLLKNVSKNTFLHPIDLSIEEGEIVAITGESGAGKSTLLRCLSTLTKPTTGEILFHGQNLALMKKEELRTFRQNIGVIFQHYHLFNSRTVFENVAYPLEITGQGLESVEEFLALVGLLDKANAYPANLSGGEKQRVAIARALVRRPKVLFCDEPTSSLDPKTTDEILELIKTANEKLGVTIILVTHDMDVVEKICHRVIRIERGAHV